MSYQERRALASLVSTALASVFYFREVYQRLPDGNPAAAEFSFWASAILIYLPVFVIFKIIVSIIFVILNTIVTQREEPDITDEFDSVVNTQSTLVFFHVFVAGFFGAMLALAAGLPPFTLFVGILLTMMTAGFSLDVSAFLFYRRGV